MVVDEKREKRRRQTSEVFTPQEFVRDEMFPMLERNNPDCWTADRTFLDPCCGNGNILVEILKKLLSVGVDPLVALSNIYGTDILEDNVVECRERLLEEVVSNLSALNEEKARKILEYNIFVADALQVNWSARERFTPDMDEPPTNRKSVFNISI